MAHLWPTHLTGNKQYIFLARPFLFAPSTTPNDALANEAADKEHSRCSSSPARPRAGRGSALMEKRTLRELNQVPATSPWASAAIRGRSSAIRGDSEMCFTWSHSSYSASQFTAQGVVAFQSVLALIKGVLGIQNFTVFFGVCQGV